MAAVRKYRGFVNKDGSGFIQPKKAIRTDDIPVTAYDAEAVEALVEAARAWLDQRSAHERQGHPLPARLPGDPTDRLIYALAPFELGEE